MIWTKYLINSSKVSDSKDFNRPYKNTDLQLFRLNKMSEVFQNLNVIHKYIGLDETKHIHFINR